MDTSDGLLRTTPAKLVASTTAAVIAAPRSASSESVLLFYADSSVLVKRHVAEVGSLWIKNLCDPNQGHEIATSRLSMVEVVSALNRRVREGSVALSDYPQLRDDVGVWQAARSRLSPVAAERLQELNLKRQRVGLDASEMQEKEALIREYEWAMLVRAKAAAVLKQRGHDVSVLLREPSSSHE